MGHLVIQIAALGHDLVREHADLLNGLGLSFRPLEVASPAVTCTSQAGFRTGLPPERHGVFGNGRFDPLTCRTDFWCQSAALVKGTRLWEAFRAKGGKVGMMFWQQSLGEDVDLVLSPAPVHKHHGGMLQDCYALPRTLYGDLVDKLGRPFPLHRYWGPLASFKSTAWITEAIRAVLADPRGRPDLLLTYLPHLDYVLQRRGPRDVARVRQAVRELAGVLRTLLEAASEQGYGVLVWGDYAIEAVHRPIHINRALLRAGLFHVRRVGRRTYPDLFRSRIVALADHQTAVLYARRAEDGAAARECLRDLPGVAGVTALPALFMGDTERHRLLAVAEAGSWFAYPWWERRDEAPDYASHVDIHNKIGYDPCELFFGWPPPGISQNPARIKGSHGRPGSRACYAANFELRPETGDLCALGRALQAALDRDT